MKKLFFIFTLLIMFGRASAQLIAILQSPPAGLIYKPQLWNIVLTNTGNQSIVLHIEVTLHVAASSQQLLTGVTKIFNLPPGTTQITATQLMPIQYNITSSNFNLDPNPLGLLPLGEFEACYHFFKHAGDAIEQIAEQCQDISVSPLSPPQLVYPYDVTAIEESNPQLSWLPPLPVQLFTSLLYDLTLVEINPNQSAADALQQNIPLYQANNLSTNALLYPPSAPSLQYNHHYAWRVAAKNNSLVVGVSEVWQFTRKQFEGLSPSISVTLPFVQLKKSPEAAYAIYSGEVKFSYFNETVDSVWKVKLVDMSSAERTEYQLPLDTLVLKRGQNLVRYGATEDAFFKDRHIYQLEIQNSRNELWRLRFEYRKPSEPNN